MKITNRNAAGKSVSPFRDPNQNVIEDPRTEFVPGFSVGGVNIVGAVPTPKATFRNILLLKIRKSKSVGGRSTVDVETIDDQHAGNQQC